MLICAIVVCDRFVLPHHVFRMASDKTETLTAYTFLEARSVWVLILSNPPPTAYTTTVTVSHWRTCDRPFRTGVVGCFQLALCCSTTTITVIRC
ncbi:hypothetical protein AVEN_180775-1 [Araneus ventricosus]|uniref:Uncharacterized protein n=1 Tax=Araneus ventricosus TaxID=182803 RepID=A0A4Y2WCQ1_ARAVE|nr:hypothetical protein AVEN_180775-1 [Araneus ventricosus]